MKTFKTNLLGLALVGLILGACSQTGTYETADLMNEQAAEKAGAKLTPFGTGNMNARDYASDSYQSGCVSTAEDTWYVTTYEHTFDATDPAKKVFVDVYNTPSKIVYKFRLQNTTLKYIEIDDVLVLNNTEVSSFTKEYDLSGSWVAGNTIAAKIEVFRNNTNGTGGGQYALFNTSYNLVGICTTTTLSAGTTDPICEDADFTLTATVSTSFETLTGGFIQILDSNDDVVASAAVTSTDRQVTYDVPTGTAGDYTYSARYVREEPRFRYQGSVSATTSTVQVIECGDCDESFGYLDNEDGTYTFTYIPAADMDNAALVFTFPQSALDSPLEGWTYNGQTMQKTMDLEACETYTWTVSLTCKPLNNPQNKWTDFKVNSTSKKGSLDNINCD